MDKQQIKELALANGFKLKEQPDGTLDLNPYVYAFAAALEAEAGRDGYFACLQKYVGGVLEFFHDELADQYAENIRQGVK